jgi:hypothetical protein
MDERIRTEMREYAWNYFIVHAEQRLKTFNFFLVLCAIICAALTAIIKDTPDVRIGIPLALLLSFLSFIFWKLDIRNKQLIGHGEAALKLIEQNLTLGHQDDKLQVLKIFTYEESITKHGRRKFLHFTYSTCFHSVFALFGIGGIIVSLLLLIHIPT